MNFIVDAQLPKKLATQLFSSGHPALHTLDFERGNRTPDSLITSLADQREAVVITKDSDFVDSHFLQDSPRRLLLVSTGNISNKELLQLFQDHLPVIISLLEESNFLELNQHGLIVH
jgi:predicted nuclease of predicted toxin-antitoxin system